MLKKISFIVAIIAALGFATAMTTPVDAKPNKNQQQQQPKKKVVIKNKVFIKQSGGGKKYIVGQKYNGHVWYGRNRHRWHGRWYGYGVGPCWINIDGEWFWNVLACPD